MWELLEIIHPYKDWTFATLSIDSEYEYFKFVFNSDTPRLQISITQMGNGNELFFPVENLCNDIPSSVLFLPCPLVWETRKIGVICHKLKSTSLPNFTVQIYKTTMPLTRNVTVTIPSNVASSVTATSVVAATSSVSLLAANTNRKGASIWNASTAVLSIEMGATATTAAFTAQLGQGDLYEVPFGYTGAISGVWAVGTGNALVREFI